MKRTVSLILAFVMLLGLLSGCVQPQEPSGSHSPSVPSTTPNAPTDQPTQPDDGDYSDIPAGFNQLVI